MSAKKLIVIALIFSFLLPLIPLPARADAWGTNYGAAILKQTLELTYQRIKEVMVATLRMIAIRVIMSRVQTLLTGSPGKFGMGSGPLVIGDWRNFIYSSAAQYSTQITNNFFQNMRSTTPQPLAQRIIDPAQKATQADIFSSQYAPNLQKYVMEGRADKIFTPGYASSPWEAWNRAAMPQNDLAFMYLRARSLQQASYEIQSESKKAEGVAGGGYKSVTAGGSTPSYTPGRGPYTAVSSQGGKVTVPPQIVTPGSTIKDIVGETQTMPLKMIANSRSIFDIATNIVTQMLSRVITQGLINLTSQANRQRTMFGM